MSADSTNPSADNPQPSNDDATNAAPKRTRTKQSFSVQDLAYARLNARGIKGKNADARVSDEKKVVRGILRSNFAFVRKNDASVKKAKDAANDRKPWPTNMNAHTRDVVLGKKRSR